MAFYEITVRGILGPRVTAALGDLPAETKGSLTVLRGELESAALSEVLGRMRDLRLELIDVRLVAASESSGPAA